MNIERWRLIEDEPKDGVWNMAVDSALLESAETGKCLPALRLYGWNMPTLSVGYGQSAYDGIDIDYLEQHNIAVVKRPTGGGAILHGDEVTYAVTVPATSEFFGSLNEIYGFAATAIREALTSLGVNVDDENRGSAPSRSTCCFAMKTRYEIASGGRKIVGSAQRRLKNSALQHGSIVLNQDGERYISCFNWRDDIERCDAISRLGSVNGFTVEQVSASSLKSAIIRSFEKLYDINFVKDQLTENERSRAERIVDSEQKLSEVV